MQRRFSDIEFGSRFFYFKRKQERRWPVLSGLRTYDTGRKHTKDGCLDGHDRETHGECPEESDAHVS